VARSWPALRAAVDRTAHEDLVTVFLRLDPGACRLANAGFHEGTRRIAEGKPCRDAFLVRDQEDHFVSWRRHVRLVGYRNRREGAYQCCEKSVARPRRPDVSLDKLGFPRVRWTRARPRSRRVTDWVRGSVGRGPWLAIIYRAYRMVCSAPPLEEGMPQRLQRRRGAGETSEKGCRTGKIAGSLGPLNR